MIKLTEGQIHYRKHREYWKKYRETHEEELKTINHKSKSKRLLFKDRRITLKEKPRTETCCICKKTIKSGKIKRTNIHHMLYVSSNPLKHTFEVCIRCHWKIHRGFE